MGRGVKAGECVLRHQSTATGYVCWGGSDAPSWIAGAVVEGCEDEFGALVSWGFGKDGDGNCCYACGMESDGDVVEVFEDVNTEGVDNAMGDQDGGVDSNCLCGCGLVAGLYSCGC